MTDFLELIGAFLFGAGGLALINVIQKRWEWRAERKAKKEDKADEKNDKLDEIDKKLTEYMKKQDEFDRRTNEQIKEMMDSDSAQSEALKYVLLDRILYIGQSYIKHGEVSFDDRKRLREMHDVYHNKIGGNGDAKFIMDAIDELPLKS